MSNKHTLIGLLSGAFAVLALTFAGLSFAGDDNLKAIADKLPGVDVDSIVESPVNGLYEVTAGAQIVYVTSDAKHLMTGEIIDLETQENLTEGRRTIMRAETLAAVNPDEMIVFAPEKTKHAITVFTDIDCGYCQKLHREINTMNDLGIEVRYLFFPRAGPGSPSWKKAEDVWCAVDSSSALTAAKARQAFESEACDDTPIAQHYALGQQLGLRGTPMIITPDGSTINGYMPADRLFEQLEKQSAN